MHPQSASTLLPLRHSSREFSSYNAYLFEVTRVARIIRVAGEFIEGNILRNVTNENEESKRRLRKMSILVEI